AAHAAAQQAAAARIARARALARARAEKTSAPMENQTDSILLREARAQVEQARKTTESADTAVTALTTAQMEQRRAEAALEATVRPRGESNAHAERLQKMGVIGDTSEGSLDIDEVFRRRRRA